MVVIDSKTLLAKDDQERTLKEKYEKMCTDIYMYRLGTIHFLELLERLEKHAGIPQDSKDTVKTN